MRIRIVKQTKPKLYVPIGINVEIPNEKIPSEISWKDIESQATDLLQKYTDAPLSSWGCNDLFSYQKELEKIDKAFSKRVSISVVLDAETRKSLCDIRSELEALHRQIGKEN